MTPEQIQQLENSILDLRMAVSEMTVAASAMSGTFTGAARGAQNLDPAMRRATSTLESSVNSTVRAGNAVQQEQIRSAQTVKQNEMMLNEATRTMTNSARTMASSLLTSSQQISALGQGASAAGAGAAAMAMKMGLSATKASALGTAIDATLGGIAEQTQAYLNVKNELIKLGGAGQHTASSLFAYAQAAGLHADSLQMMIGPMKALGSNIMGLGRGAGDAQKAFMEMLQVSDQERERFARLGIMQEELISRQGEYVALQTSTGSSIRMQNLTMDQLRKASTDYIRNLYELSALSGDEVNATKQKMQAALEERRIMLMTIAKQQEVANLLEEAKRLRAAGDEPGAKAAEQRAAEIQRDLEVQRQIVANLADLPDRLRQGVIQAMTSGGISGEESGDLGRMQALPQILEEIRKARAGEQAGDQTAFNIKRLIAEQGYQAAPGLYQALNIGDPRLAQGYGYDPESMKFMTKYKDRPEGELEDVRKNRIAAEQQGIDAASDFQAALQTTVIKFGQAIDQTVQNVNPLIQGFDLLKDSANAASIALQKLSPDYRKTPDDIAAETAINAVEGSGAVAEKTNNFLNDILDGVNKIAQFLGLPSANIVSTPQGRRQTDEEAAPGGESSFSRRPPAPPPPPREDTPPPEPDADAPAPAPDADEPILETEPAPEPSTAETEAPVVEPDRNSPIEEPATPPDLVEDTDQTPPPPPTTPTDAPSTGTPADAPVLPTAETEAPVVEPDRNSPIEEPDTPPEIPYLMTPELQDWVRTVNGMGVSREQMKKMLMEQSGYTANESDEIINRVLGNPTTTPNAEQPPEVPKLPDQANTTDGTPRTNEYLTRIQDAIKSGGLTAATPQNVQSKIKKPALQEGNIETSQQKLIDSGLLRSNIFRGPQEFPDRPELLGKKPGGADANPATTDTQGEGYGLSPKLIEAVMKLQGVELGKDAKGRPFTLSKITALNDYYHALKHPNSAHTKGRAVDFILNRSPKKEEADVIRETLSGLGFVNIKDEYHEPTSYTKGAHFHAEVPKLLKGGIVSGSRSGYTATLHGNEIVVPLDPNSLLAELGKKSQEQVKTEMSSFENSIKTDRTDVGVQDFIKQNQQLMEMLSYKLDGVLNKLDTSNYTQDKILKYSQA